MSSTFLSRIKRIRSAQAGLSFMEAVVTIALFSLVLTVAMEGIVRLYDTHRYGIEQALATASGGKGVSTMVRTIREATYSDNGDFPIVTAASSTFTFYADINDDGSAERVRFFLNGTMLTEGITPAAGVPPVYSDTYEILHVVSPYVRNASSSIPMFRYFNQNGVEVTSAADLLTITFVTVRLIVNVTVSTLPQEYTLMGSTALRNLIPDR